MSAAPEEDLVEPPSPPASLVTYRVGGREYPWKFVRQCVVCRSPWRSLVEERLVGGDTYQRIVDVLDEDANISIRNIGDHFRKGHMPSHLVVVRQTVEERAVSLGKKIEDDRRSLVDGISMLRVVVEKTFQEIAAGRITPDLREGLAAVKMLGDFGDYDNAGLDVQAVVDAFTVYHQQAQDIMTPEQYEAFGDALLANPVLAALEARINGEEEPEETDEPEQGPSGNQEEIWDAEIVDS